MLMIGTALDGSLVDAISGHILTSELAGTASYHWEIKHPPTKVRDFAIDPYQDLLVLMEESVDEYVLPPRFVRKVDKFRFDF